MDPETLKRMQIFHPYTIERMERVKDGKIRFVHYTSAENAMNIIRNGEVWMRKSSIMNDFMEIDHGLACLGAAWRSEDSGTTFKETLDKIYDGLAEEVGVLFDGWVPHFKFGTYLASLSEHGDDEDKSGRLSMWRAYGSTCGVGLVLNNHFIFNETDALKAYTNPVAYLDEDGFKEKFEELTRSVSDNCNSLNAYTRDELTAAVFNAFKYAVLCTKHPGFKEEREWRVVYTPAQERSAHISEALVTIDGVPQNIQKILLRNIPEEGLVGIEIPELINRVIVGPTNYPAAISEAFVEALTAANVPEAGRMVWASDIPIRR